MNWKTLLTTKRVESICEGSLCETTESEYEETRHDFEKDWDQLVYSYPFRRLQDKTQVIPFPKTDFVHSRLTHSLEVATVGRSLGTMLGNYIAKDLKKLKLNPEHLGILTASACLCHDIGNPPFGHSGEDSIAHYFQEDLPTTGRPFPRLTDVKEQDGKYLMSIFNNSVEKKVEVYYEDIIINHKRWIDLAKFEGNANGFRILTNCTSKGINPTIALLGAFSKYPRESWIETDKDPELRKKRKSQSKFGVFQTERDVFKKAAEELGLVDLSSNENDLAYCRHPLSFLMEAADDICYGIIDFEDGIRQGLIDYFKSNDLEVEYIIKKKEEKKDITISAKDILIQLCCNDKGFQKSNLEKFAGNFKNEISYLRGVYINLLTHECFNVFKANYESIMSGEFDSDLISQIDNDSIQKHLKAMKLLIKKYVYNSTEVLQTEAAGFEVLGGLLNTFIDSANICFTCEPQYMTKKQKKNLSLIPHEFRPLSGEEDKREFKHMYARMIRITDYISGMTDSYALELYRNIRGISDVK